MKVLIEIPTEDFNAIQFHSVVELGINFAQEVFDRIVAGEEIIDRDFSAIKGKCAVCPHCENCDVDDETLEIKALEQQPCEDCISRQAVLDTLDKMDKALDTDRTVENYKELLTECYKVLPSVGKDINVTTTDAISRKDMLAVFSQSNSLTQAWNGFEKLPSVTPKEKTSKWIMEDMFDGDVAYRCSECNELFWIESGTPKDNEYNFCPNCGARMVIE